MEGCKKIEVIFENCETVDITKAVGDFNLGAITESIHRIATNSIDKIKRCDEVSLEIYHDGQFEGSSLYDEYTPFDRLSRSSDITSIELTYTDGTSDDIYVDFDGDYSNKNQSSKISSKGDLYIVISPTKTVENIYTDEVINELSAAKELYMENDVQAENYLANNGWKILWKSGETFQALNSTKVITLSKLGVHLTDISKGDVHFSPQEFYNICSVLFDILQIHNNYNSENCVYIEGKNRIVEEKENGDQIITIEMTLPDKTPVTLRYLVTEQDKKEFNNYTGTLTIGDIELVGMDVVSFMWIYHNYLDDEFWGNYKG